MPAIKESSPRQPLFHAPLPPSHDAPTMNPDVSQLRRELNVALARYEQWEHPLRRFRSQGMARLNRDGFTWDDLDRGLRELDATLRTKRDPRDELHPLFDRLCRSYIDGDAARRDDLRNYVAERKLLGRLLGRYANFLAGQIQGADDEPLVVRALTALALENCESDYRDALMTLADLYAAAENVGIDPRPAFSMAAEMSTDELTAGGCESLARTLREFHASSVLRERRSMGVPYGGPT